MLILSYIDGSESYFVITSFKCSKFTLSEQVCLPSPAIDHNAGIACLILHNY